MPDRDPSLGRILIHNENRFFRELEDLRHAGREGAHARQEALGVLALLRAGRDAESAGTLTHHGEDRVPGCFKYDLGSGYRLVCQRLPDVGVCLLKVGSHDTVTAWLKRHKGFRLTKDARTGALLPVYDLDLPEHSREEHQRRAQEPGPSELLGLLGKSPPPELTGATFTTLTTASADDDLMSAVETLPTATQDWALSVLLSLRGRDVQNAERLIAERAGRLVTPTPEQLFQALGDEVNKDSIVDLTDLSDEEFDRLQRASFVDWLVYLHPNQKRVVDEDYSGPAILHGVPGSGKTSVVVHRAVSLARRYPTERVAVVALTPVLAALLASLVRQVEDDPALNVDVFDVSTLARRVIQHFRPGAVLQSVDPRSTESVEDCWVELWEDPDRSAGLSLLRADLMRLGVDTERYIRDEFAWIRSAFARAEPLPRRDLYADPQRTERAGRAIGLSEQRRREVLSAVEDYEDYMAAGAIWDDLALVEGALNFWASLPGPFGYRCVLVDEYQDFGTLEMSLVARLVTHAENGLFLAGDPRQQVLPRRLVLSDAGIDGEVRRRFFRKSYRNTKEIFEAGLRLRAQLQADVDELEPQSSARSGPRPTCYEVPDAGAERQLALDEIASYRRASAAPVVVAVAAIREDDESALVAERDQLISLGLACQILGREGAVPVDGAAYVSSLERLKGFEFGLVVIVGCAAGTLPSRGLPEGEHWREARRFFVALTRGRDRVVLTSPGPPSSFVHSIGAEVIPAGLVPGPGAADVERVEEAEDATLLPVVEALSQLGYRTVDKRPSGGSLWLIGGLELESPVRRLSAAGFSFSFTPRGGRASRWQPAWWATAAPDRMEVRPELSAPS